MNRKIDALVAEYVFKKRYWKERRGTDTFAVTEHEGREPWTSRRFEHQEPERYTPITAMEAVQLGFWGDSDRNLPRYSDDIAAAMEAVAKLEGDHTGTYWLADLCRKSGDSEPWGAIRWTCTLRRLGGSWPKYDREPGYAIGVDDTAPLAISLAALRAVGVPEEKIEEAMR